MKKILLVILISAPFVMMAQEKGIPDRNNSNINANQSLFSNNIAYEYAEVKKSVKDGATKYEATYFDKLEKEDYITLEYSTMLEALNDLGKMGFELKMSERYEFRDYEYQVFYLAKSGLNKDVRK
jgi:hypothetical protein